MKLTLLRAALLSLAAMAFSPAAQAETVSYDNPKVGSNPLDLCLTWGSGCGKPAADAWCVNNGFTESTSHVVANDIGLSTPTRLISNGAVCDQSFCDGISQVTCSRPDPVTKVYEKPKLNGNRLDLCVDWGVDCGQPAANAFCVSKGYSVASDYVVAENIGGSSPTRLIGTGAVCDQGYCDGFKEITCSN